MAIDKIAAGRFDPPSDLKRTAALGVMKSVAGQATSFVLRIGSMVVLARLVTPEQFGLVGMVTAFVGLLSLFRDAGLSNATVQRATISHGLLSTLFWVNLGVGLALAALTAAAAPAIAAFYSDQRLVWITVGLSTNFILNGAMAQHRALLQRRMRFGALAVIDIVAVAVSVVVGVSMALAAMGYWALVGAAVSQPFTSAAGAWIAARWVPGLPSRVEGLRSMLHYGGVVTLNSLVVYVAYNADKILLGRAFGAEALGIYGRAQQLISLPTENLHTSLGWVMFPTLSRVQNEPQRQRNYFLKGYGLFLSIVMPITMACALFADEIVQVFLGPQWDRSVPIFRYLAPTVLAFALINPMGHLMMASGHAVRSLKVALLILPVVIGGYVIGLPHGPAGVALGFSAAMLVLIVPVLQWAKRGTLITSGDLVRTAVPPMLSSALGAVAAVLVAMPFSSVGALGRLVVHATALFATHILVLLCFAEQKQTFREMFDAVTGRATAKAAVHANSRA